MGSVSVGRPARIGTQWAGRVGNAVNVAVGTVSPRAVCVHLFVRYWSHVFNNLNPVLSCQSSFFCEQVDFAEYLKNRQSNLSIDANYIVLQKQDNALSTRPSSCSPIYSVIGIAIKWHPNLKCLLVDMFIKLPSCRRIIGYTRVAKTCDSVENGASVVIYFEYDITRLWSIFRNLIYLVPLSDVFW